jgi:hypothetical protein
MRVEAVEAVEATFYGQEVANGEGSRHFEQRFIQVPTGSRFQVDHKLTWSILGSKLLTPQEQFL